MTASADVSDNGAPPSKVQLLSAPRPPEPIAVVDPPSAPADGRLGWAAIGLLAAVQFVAYVDRALPAVTAPLIRLELGLSDARIGALQGPAFVALYVVGLLAAGHWVRVADPWRLALACLLVWTTGTAVFALAPDYGWMVAGRVLLGAGQAAFVPTALMLIAAQSDPARRARALSLFTTGSASGRSGALLLGGAALLAFGGGVAGLAGWRAASLALAAPNLVLAVLLVVAALRIPPPAPPQSHGGLGAALRAAARRPAAFASIAAAGAACVFVIQAAGAWAPSVLNRAFHLSPGDSALAFGVVVLIFAPLGHLGGGWLMAGRQGRRDGPAPFVIAAVLVAAACAAALPFVGRLEALALIAGLTVSGGLAAAVVLIGLQAMTEPPLRPAMGALFMAVISVAGVGGGPWLTGLVSDALHGARHGLALALAVVVVAGAAAALALGLCAGRLWRPDAGEAAA